MAVLAGAVGPAAAAEKLPVVATFSILGDLVRNVGGERVEVTTLVGPNGDAHVFSPTPADGRALTGAKLIVVNGLKFEGWMDRLVKASGAQAPVVSASRGITTLRVPGHKGHAHGHADRHGHDHRGDVDPHAWQDVRNAAIYVENIRDALVSVDPSGRATYEANARAYLAELDALHTEIARMIATIPAAGRRIVTSHDSFAYFAKAYGLEFRSPRGISTDAEASAKEVAALIRQIRRENIKAVFVENVSDPRLVQQIARETGARIGGRLYSDALSDANGPAATYIGMMRHNIRELSKALGES
jgi:zinc/manganese transport system substrate-binding protein